jgi:hypothetical protein
MGIGVYFPGRRGFGSSDDNQHTSTVDEKRIDTSL